jgi:ribonuclease HII
MAPVVRAGLDEAGVGPAFGSLWAAAVVLREGQAWPAGLTDSKKLSAARREALRARLEERCAYGLGEVTAAEIDADGLGRARRLVFARALDDLRARFPHEPMPTELIVDGTLFGDGWRGVPHTCVPKADATVPEAAAASVLAKTTRDAQVLALCDAEPTLDERYAIRSNKGYLSAAHVAGLRAHGWTAHHRRTYRVRALAG